MSGISLFPVHTSWSTHFKCILTRLEVDLHPWYALVIPQYPGLPQRFRLCSIRRFRKITEVYRWYYLHVDNCAFAISLSRPWIVVTPSTKHQHAQTWTSLARLWPLYLTLSKGVLLQPSSSSWNSAHREEEYLDSGPVILRSLMVRNCTNAIMEWIFKAQRLLVSRVAVW